MVKIVKTAEITYNVGSLATAPLKASVGTIPAPIRQNPCGLLA